MSPFYILYLILPGWTETARWGTFDAVCAMAGYCFHKCFGDPGNSPRIDSIQHVVHLPSWGARVLGRPTLEEGNSIKLWGLEWFWKLETRCRPKWGGGGEWGAVMDSLGFTQWISGLRGCT